MAENPEPGASLGSIQIQLAEVKKNVELLKDLFVSQKDFQTELRSLRKEFADLNTQVKVESNFYKWIASTSVFVALVLGAFGYSQWHDIINGLRTSVTQTSEYQDDLAHGLVLANGRRPQDAVAFLQRCYKKTPTDQTVASQLLYSLQSSDDWISANQLADEAQERIGTSSIHDPWFVNNIGLSLLYEGREDRQKLALAGTLFKQTAPRVKNDADERSIWINLWVYYLFNDQLPDAEANLERAYLAKSSEIDKATWEEKDWRDQADWSLFKHLAEANKNMPKNAEEEITKMLKQHKRRAGKQPCSSK